MVNKSKREIISLLWKWYRKGCPETSLTNYHYMLRNTTEELRFVIHICLHNIHQHVEKGGGIFPILQISLVSWIHTKISKESVVTSSG